MARYFLLVLYTCYLDWFFFWPCLWNPFPPTDSRQVYLLLLVYGTVTTIATLPCVALVLQLPSAGVNSLPHAVTDFQRAILLSSYVPFLLLPFTMTIDMWRRVSSVLTTLGESATLSHKKINWNVFLLINSTTLLKITRGGYHPISQYRRSTNSVYRVVRDNVTHTLQAHLPSKAIIPAPKSITVRAKNSFLFDIFGMAGLNKNSWASS